MSWITVRSPHDASDVKVREKDVGRSVRDGAGRVFFLLQKADGSYYSSLTREGGPDQEAAYDRMLGQERHAQAVGHDVTKQQLAASKKGGSGKLVVMGFILVVVVALWAIFFGPLKGVVWTQPPGAESQTETQNDSQEPKGLG